MYDDSYSAAAALSTIFAIYAGILLFSLLIAAGFYVLMAISLSSLFRKVGIEGWKAWVPYYSTWVWLELGGQRGWISLLSFVPGGSYVAAVFLYIGMYRTGKAFGKDGAFLLLGIFLPFVWAFILGGRNGGEYHPEWFAAYGWPPPYVGHGGVPAEQRHPDAVYAEYARQQQANQQQEYARQQWEAQQQWQAAQQAQATQQAQSGQQPPAV